MPFARPKKKSALPPPPWSGCQGFLQEKTWKKKKDDVDRGGREGGRKKASLDGMNERKPHWKNDIFSPSLRCSHVDKRSGKCGVCSHTKFKLGLTSMAITYW